MENRPLERIVINCHGCKNERENLVTDTQYNSSTTYKIGGDSIILEKPFHSPSCEICKLLYEFLEKRGYDQSKADERRKNK